MEIWTRQRTHLGWTPWPNVACGLATLLDAADAQVLLLTEAPDVERLLLIAALRLVHAIVEGQPNVVVASPHPSADLVEFLIGHGVRQIWAVERRGTRRASTLENISELGPGVCPQLHAKTDAGKTLSLCGCRHDRMVLAGHQMRRWCLLGSRNCPHWRHHRACGSRCDATLASIAGEERDA